MKSSAVRLAFLVATPLVLALVLWFHPNADGDTLYEALRNDVTAMLVVHVTMLFFIPLMALAAFVLLNGIQCRAATVGPPFGYASYFGAGLLWLAAAVAVVLALRKRAPRPPLVLMTVGALVFAAGHALPTGPIGMAIFVVGVMWLEASKFNRRVPPQPA